MTQFWEDDERPQGVMGASTWGWGKIGRDLMDTMALLWRQTCVPAFKTFGYMAIVLVKACVLGTLATFSKAKSYYLQEQLTAAGFGAGKHLQQLSTQSAIYLRKIQGAIGDNWASASRGYAELGQTGRWQGAQRKLSGKLVSSSWLELGQGQSTLAANDPAQEEMMDLNELFDRPISEDFLEEPPQKKAFNWAEKPKPQQPASSASNSSIEDMVQALMSDYSLNAALPKAQPMAETPQGEASKSIPAIQQSCSNNQANPDPMPCQDAQDGEMDCQMEEPTPFALPSDVSPHLLERAPLDYPLHAVPWFAQEGDNPLAALDTVPASNVPWLAPELFPQPEPPKPKPKPVVKPIIRTGKIAPPPNPELLPPAPAPKPLRMEHELSDTMDGFDHMLQNNRILSNSISNLVDNYFRKAAEEKPNY